MGFGILGFPVGTSGGAVSCLERDFLPGGEKKYRATRMFFCAFCKFSLEFESVQASQSLSKRSFVKRFNSSFDNRVASGLDTNSLECL